MPIRRIIKRPCLAVILLALAACGTSPEPNFYTLATVSGASATGIHDTIKVVKPDLPQFLDRPDFVSQTSPYQISINETANWGEPLASLFERILADDLQQRLPQAIVETDADDKAPSTPRYIIETKIQQFNAQAQGQMVLLGDLQLTDLSKNMPTQNMAIHLTVDNRSSDPVTIAAGLSNLIGQYADQIAANLVPHTQP